jgi:para-nitrobenzyl esterase
LSQNETIMKTVTFILLFGVLLTAHDLPAQSDYGFPVQTRIENGIIEGSFDTKTNLQTFLGVPFAKPPVGELRWKAPQPLDNWTGVKETKAFGPRPVQGIVFGDMSSRSKGISEDCLYLNVWSPAKKTTAGLPVLVYFYGGGFVAGDGSEPRYDGASMAKKGIVVVTVNYRLGLFGFFAHPELSKETSYKGSGNWGLLDQAFALKWVNKNIAAFGGDAKKVTIAGESAGSISVSAQMVSPLSKGLIAGAIGESGSGISSLSAVPLAEAEKQGQEFASKAGYASVADMRKASTLDLFTAYQDSRRFGFPSVIDGYFYPKTMAEIFKAKEQAQVPLLLGWNSAEITGMAFMQGMPIPRRTSSRK